MEERYSSASSRAASPHPGFFRKRSNSFPIVDALGCSTPEAELIMAEGRAAVRSRHAASQRRGRRNRSDNDDVRTFNPRDHLQYLGAAAEDERETPDDRPQHSRVLSSSTDRSTSTVTGPIAPPTEAVQSPRSPPSPLGDYSANLAKFVQAQLSSIPSYQRPIVYPRSCPDLLSQSKTPPMSPTMADRRTAHISHVIEIPSVRPPLRSAFSEWSSTDDDTDEDLPHVPNSDKTGKDAKYTPSLLRYYETSNDSFLFSSTPMEEDEVQHPNLRDFSFPRPPEGPAATSDTHSSDDEDDGYPSSALSNHPQLSSSSAPSLSSTSTASYFDFKRPITLPPHVRERIVAAVSPHPSKGKVLPAISPFEGGALANVHDILVESQNRVLVDGLSFDLIHDLNVPEDITRQTAPRVTTPC